MKPLYEYSVEDTLSPRAVRFGVSVSTPVTVCVAVLPVITIFFVLFDMFFPQPLALFPGLLYLCPRRGPKDARGRAG